jgi:hypothetical protein
VHTGRNILKQAIEEIGRLEVQVNAD